MKRIKLILMAIILFYSILRTSQVYAYPIAVNNDPLPSNSDTRAYFYLSDRDENPGELENGTYIGDDWQRAIAEAWLTAFGADTDDWLGRRNAGMPYYKPDSWTGAVLKFDVRSGSTDTAVAYNNIYPDQISPFPNRIETYLYGFNQNGLGSIEYFGSPVSISPAILLMCSGLIIIVGIRRRVPR